MNLPVVFTSIFTWLWLHTTSMKSTYRANIRQLSQMIMVNRFMRRSRLAVEKRQSMRCALTMQTACEASQESLARSEARRRLRVDCEIPRSWAATVWFPSDCSSARLIRNSSTSPSVGNEPR